MGKESGLMGAKTLFILQYALPTPKGGRHVNNIVLREDQREYVKAQQRKPKKALDLFDPDFIPLAGKTGGVHLGKTASNMYGTDRIGFGRKNPNASGKSRNRRKQIRYIMIAFYCTAKEKKDRQSLSIARCQIQMHVEMIHLSCSEIQ